MHTFYYFQFAIDMMLADSTSEHKKFRSCLQLGHVLNIAIHVNFKIHDLWGYLDCVDVDLTLIKILGKDSKSSTGIELMDNQYGMCIACTMWQSALTDMLSYGGYAPSITDWPPFLLRVFISLLV